MRRQGTDERQREVVLHSLHQEFSDCFPHPNAEAWVQKSRYGICRTILTRESVWLNGVGKKQTITSWPPIILTFSLLNCRDIQGQGTVCISGTRKRRNHFFARRRAWRISCSCRGVCAIVCVCLRRVKRCSRVHASFTISIIRNSIEVIYCKPLIIWAIFGLIFNLNVSIRIGLCEFRATTSLKHSHSTSWISSYPFGRWLV